MNAKKLLAGVLAGAMVLGTAAVPTLADDPNYKAKQKILPIVKKVTSVGSVSSKWWDPNTFSDAFRLTDKAVTISFYQKTPGKAAEVQNELAYVNLYSSDTGAMYGSQEADASYSAGKKANMVEYICVRGDAWAYSGTGGNMVWTDEGEIDGSQIGKDVTFEKIEDLPDSWSDNWYAGAQKVGNVTTINAYVSNGVAYMTVACRNKGDSQGVVTKTTVPVGKKNVFICLGSGSEGGTISDIKYCYASVSENEVISKASKTTFTYNGKYQKPTISVKDKAGKTIPSSNYTVKYSNAKSKDAGTYQATLTFKAGSDYDSLLPRVYNYTIKKASQKIVVNKSKITAKVVDKKLKKVKKNKTYSVVVNAKSAKITKKSQLKVSSSKSSAVSAKVTKLKSGKYTVAITVKKGCKKGTYKVRFAASELKNYAESATKEIKVYVK